METAYLMWRITGWMIRVVMVLVVPHRRPPAQARAWLFFILLLPVPGLVAYHLFGRVYQPGRMERMRARIMRQIKRAVEQWQDRSQVVEDAPLPPHLHGVPLLAEVLGGFPIMKGNSVEVFDTCPEAEDMLVADINAAKHHAHLLYYIFENDHSGQRVAHALTRAATRGVACRVLMDAVGSSGGLKHLRHRMENAGVEVVETMPVGYFKKKAARFDLRNHRKIAVFDGCTAHIGSANIIDPAFRDDHKCEEMVLRVNGPVVAQLQVIFLSDRYLELEEKIESPDLFPHQESTGTVHAQALPSGPVYEFSHTRKVLTTLMHNATTSITITTPYFIPDAAYINALQSASLRGVEARLIVPLLSDSQVVTWAQESFFSQLLAAGVRVHCFQPGLLHSKMVTVDGRVAFIGSANMDIRSHDLNREITLMIYDEEVVRRLTRTERHYLDHSIEIVQQRWSARPRLRRFIQNFARLFDTVL